MMSLSLQKQTDQKDEEQQQQPEVVAWTNTQ